MNTEYTSSVEQGKATYTSVWKDFCQKNRLWWWSRPFGKFKEDSEIQNL